MTSGPLLSALLVAVGAFTGALVRYALVRTVRTTKMGSAAAILTANIIGSFILGILFAWSSADGYLLLGVGFCGALTTFSTFSLDTLEFVHAGRSRAAVLYVVGSTAACVLAVVLGSEVGRLVGLS